MWMPWKDALRNKRFIFMFITSLVGLIAFAWVLPHFFIEILLPKPGSPLNDVVLNFFTPKDWSIEIFVLIYLSTLVFLGFNFSNPKIVLITVQTYVVVNFMRIISLYLFTLEAPEGIIPLTDPFLAVFAYGQPIYVKDLFFSGHISTLSIFCFIEPRARVKMVFILATMLATLLLAWQRVHYTLDMLAAPLISWGVFEFFKWINLKSFHKNLTLK